MIETKIKAGIIGATGYAGAELVRLLLMHPYVDVVYYGSRSYEGQRYTEIYPNCAGRLEGSTVCGNDSLDILCEKADVIFTATPQGLCASLISEDILQKSRIIDLSADFRLKDQAVYEKWYGITHANPSFLNKSVYGLCEINRDQIKSTRLVANPGCYTTCSILTLYPLVKEHLIDPNTIIIDAKSGTSGAGRSSKTANLFCEVNENIKAYGVTSHRHTPEIEEQLSIAYGNDIVINFTPHLVPMNRGILATCYAKLTEGADAGKVRAAYEAAYKEEYFIRLMKDGALPETRWVEGSNYVDIGWKIDNRTNRIIAIGAIDNLVKGAAGQAVQNMNLMFGLPECAGLEMVPLFP